MMKFEELLEQEYAMLDEGFGGPFEARLAAALKSAESLAGTGFALGVSTVAVANYFGLIPVTVILGALASVSPVVGIAAIVGVHTAIAGAVVGLLTGALDWRNHIRRGDLTDVERISAELVGVTQDRDKLLAQFGNEIARKRDVTRTAAAIKKITADQKRIGQELKREVRKTGEHIFNRTHKRELTKVADAAIQGKLTYLK